MSDDFSLPQLGDTDGDFAPDSIRDGPTTPKSAADLEQLFDVPVMVSAVLGAARMPIGDLLRLGPAPSSNSTAGSARPSTSTSTTAWSPAARWSSWRTAWA